MVDYYLQYNACKEKNIWCLGKGQHACHMKEMKVSKHIIYGECQEVCENTFSSQLWDHNEKKFVLNTEPVWNVWKNWYQLNY